MAENQSGFDMAEYEHQQDSMLSGVMPDTWPGHGRMVINARNFSQKERTFASKLFNRLKEKYPDQPTEKLARKASNMTEEKLDG